MPDPDAYQQDKSHIQNSFQKLYQEPRQPINTHHTHNQEIQMRTVGDQFTPNGKARVCTKCRWGGRGEGALTLWLRLKIGPTTLERDLVISGPAGEYIYYSPVIQHTPKKPSHTHTSQMSQAVRLSTVYDCKKAATTQRFSRTMAKLLLARWRFTCRS